MPLAGRTSTAWGVVLVLLSLLCALPAQAQEPKKETEADRQFDLAESLFKIKVYKTAAPVYRQFLKEFPQDPRCEEARYKLALSYFNLGGEKNQKKALAELITLRKQFPSGKRSQDGLFRSGHLRYIFGDSKGAVADLLALSKLKVRADLKIPMHHFLGRSYYDLGQHAEAVRHLAVVAKAPKANPLRQYALIVLADAHLKLSKVADHAATLDMLLKDYAGSPTQEEMWLRLGDARLALRQFAPALAAYAKLNPKGQYKDRAALGKGRALFGLKRYPEAAKVCKALLAGFQETPANKSLKIPEQCLYIVGLSSFNQGGFAEAAGAFAGLLARVKQGAMAEDGAYKLCWSYYRLGGKSAKKLVASCVNFRRLFPASKWVAQVTFMAAEGYLRLGDYPNAVAHYGQIGPKDPNYADALYRIAYSSHKQNKREDAARAYDVFLAKAGEHVKKVSALLSAGALYQTAGKYKEAVDRYDKYLAAKPTGPEVEEVMYQRGVCYAKMSRFDDMAAAFTQYAAKYPNGRYVGTVFYWLGRHHRIRGDALAEKRDAAGAVKEYAAAEKAWRSSLGLKGPHRDETLLGLAECCYNLGENQAAQAAELAAKAKAAKGDQKKLLERQADKLGKDSTASFQKAAEGFLGIMTRKPAMLRLESVYFWTGTHFREHGDPASAIRAFQAVLRNLKSKRAVEALHQLALLHAELKPPDNKSVVRYCDQLLKQSPDSKLALQTKFVKAEALYRESNTDNAAADLYLQVSRKGTGLLKVASVTKLGHISFARGEYAAAARYFAEIGLLYDDKVFTPEALYFAGRANVLLKDLDEAVKFWGQLLKRYAGSKWAAQAKKGLRPLGYVATADGSIQKK